MSVRSFGSAFQYVVRKRRLTTHMQLVLKRRSQNFFRHSGLNVIGGSTMGIAVRKQSSRTATGSTPEIVRSRECRRRTVSFEIMRRNRTANIAETPLGSCDNPESLTSPNLGISCSDAMRVRPHPLILVTLSKSSYKMHQSQCAM